LAGKKKEPKKPKQFRSGFEKKVAASLQERDVLYEYETERLAYVVPSSSHYYVPDFKLPNGIYVEAKGIFDRDARVKMALVMEQNPDKDIRLLFMRNNKINKAAKMTYADWCEKRGMKFAVSSIGIIPEEWLREDKKKPVKPKRSSAKPLDTVVELRDESNSESSEG